MTKLATRPRSATARPVFFEFRQELDEFDRSFSEVVASLMRAQRPISDENEQRYTHGRSWTHPAGDNVGEMQVISSMTEVSFDDIVSGKLARLPESIAQIVQEMSKHFAEMFYGAISEGAERIGNVTSAAEAGSFAAGFLEAIRKIEFGVDRQGNVSLPELHVGPGASERMIAELEAQPPEFHEEIERLKIEKTKQALAREAQRKQRYKGYDAE